MKYKNLVFILMLLLVLVGCIATESIYLASAKQRLQTQISTELSQFLEQQQQLLLRLGKQLQPAINANDSIYISQQLRTFEDQIFMLAKQGWTIPIRVQWMSLNVPPQIITSEGNGNSELLVPDERYYMQIVNNPQQLQVSETYTSHAMPEYNLQNFGLADDQANNVGLLDATVPLDILSAHIKENLGSRAKYFTVKISDLQRPSIIASNNHFWNTIFKINTMVFIICSLLYWLVLWGIKLYMGWQSKCTELRLITQKIDDLSHMLKLSKQAVNTHMKYSKLVISHDNANQKNVMVAELLRDVQAVNAEVAMQRTITMTFPLDVEPQWLITGSQTRLMQVLTQVLQEMLQQLPPHSVIEIQVSISNISTDERRVIFKFIDDGFYKELSTQAWCDIQQLIELEGGTLEHTHAAYAGNTISVEFLATLGNNIIHLEHYLAKV